MLISQLPRSDLNVHEYIHIEDEMLEGGITDEEIVDTIRNANKEEECLDETDFIPILQKVSLTEAEIAIDKTIRFLYEQESEFGNVNEELRILRELNRRVRLRILKNFKQVDLHYFQVE